MKKVVIVSHADADGHVIAEQTKRNLSAISTFDVTTVVDPKRTLNHKSWLQIDGIHEAVDADIVVFVDLMFGPMTYAAETEALGKFVRGKPSTRFFLIDHHPLPERRLSAMPNMRAIYRPDVAECTLGPRSGLMVIAALCENQQPSVDEILLPHHANLARGVRLAAALGGTLPGEKLMALLAERRWDLINEIGQESKEYHRLVRGRRTANSLRSPALDHADREAAGILKRSTKAYDSGRAGLQGSDLMPFDVEAERYQATRPSDASDGVVLRNAPKRTQDVEVISTLLEIAALSLTTSPESTFTKDQLLAEMRSIAGDETEIASRDVESVMDKATFLQKAGGKFKLN